MMTLAYDRSFECAPHATRSVSMALTLGFNLAIVLFALLPSTPFPVHAPPPQSLIASVLPPPPRPVAPPVVPTVPTVKPAVVPNVALPTTHPAPIAVPTWSSITPIAPVAITHVATAQGPAPVAPVGYSDATIAYETATPPAYPVAALRAGIQGTVLLKVLVGPDGKPLQVVVEHGSGNRLLDRAARQHVLAKWRFHPAMRNGHAIEAWALVPVRFSLNRG